MWFMLLGRVKWNKVDNLNCDQRHFMHIWQLSRSDFKFRAFRDEHNTAAAS